jgi:4-hydroxy-4-methyl-2-oxoglutarate aldolase
MGFPVWSAAVSAQGGVKATAGAVNVPIVVGGQLVRPGDVVLADDDGVVCVPRDRVDEALTAGRARLDKEEAARRVFRDGELGLDRYGLRATLAELGVRYVPASEVQT